mgnify:CR=1 FL=1
MLKELNYIKNLKGVSKKLSPGVCIGLQSVKYDYFWIIILSSDRFEVWSEYLSVFKQIWIVC